MDEDRIWCDLNDINLNQFVCLAHEVGRASIPLALRSHAATLYQGIVACRRDDGSFLSRPLWNALEIAERILWTEHYLCEFSRANYPAYVGARVLNWFLGTHRRSPYTHIWSNCRRALGALLEDLRQFEARSLSGQEQHHRLNFNPDVVARRVELLGALPLVMPAVLDIPHPIPAANTSLTWSACARDTTRLSVLLPLTLLPLTQEHDEVFFLRLLQMSECCFWGTLTAVIAALEEAKRGCPSGLEFYLMTAISFADALMPLFRVLKETLPPSHFLAFRDATDGSSALQSRSYQLLQIFTQGIDETKTPVMADVPELADLLAYDHPQFVHLRGLVQSAGAREALGGERFIGLVASLDRALHSWRSTHLGRVRATLSEDVRGTGGAGVAYLQRHVLHKILSAPRARPPVDEKPRLAVKAVPVFSPLN